MDVGTATQLQHALAWAREDCESKDVDEILVIAARYKVFLLDKSTDDEPSHLKCVASQ